MQSNRVTRVRALIMKCDHFEEPIHDNCRVFTFYQSKVSISTSYHSISFSIQKKMKKEFSFTFLGLSSHLLSRRESASSLKVEGTFVQQLFHEKCMESENAFLLRLRSHIWCG